MTQQITLDELERYLWQAAVDLRGQIDAAAYKDYIFPLVFFKRICDVRDEEYAGYEQEGGKEFADMMMQDSPIQIPMEAHWNVVFNTSENIGQALVDAFRQIELANPGKKIDGKVVGGLEGIFGVMLLKKGYTIRDVAKLTRKGVSTIQRVKKEFQL